MSSTSLTSPFTKNTDVPSTLPSSMKPYSIIPATICNADEDELYVEVMADSESY